MLIFWSAMFNEEIWNPSDKKKLKKAFHILILLEKF